MNMDLVEIIFKDGLKVIIPQTTRAIVKDGILTVYYETLFNHKAEIETYKMDEIQEFTVI